MKLKSLFAALLVCAAPAAFANGAAAPLLPPPSLFPRPRKPGWPA